MTAAVPDPRCHYGPSTKAGVDPAGLAMMAFAGLNLNGVASILSGQQALLSPLALALVGILLLRYGSRSRIYVLHYILAAFFISYLTFGFIAQPLHAGAPQMLRMYFMSFLLITTTSFWFLALKHEALSNALRAFKNLLLLACFAAILFAIFGIRLPYDSTSDTRFSGLFGNPDESAMIALYGMVAVLSFPSRTALLTIGQLAVFATALALAFSKSGILIAFAISAFFALRKGSILLLIGLLAAWSACFGMLWLIYDSHLDMLTSQQQERIGELIGFLAGRVDSDTTTGRTAILDFGLDQIWQVMPWGAGLDTFHHMLGGLRNSKGDWLGIHNTYLMVLGEAGIIPALLLIVFVAWLLYLGLKQEKYGNIIVGFCIVLFANMLTTHNALTLRFHDVALGIIMALALTKSTQHKKF